MGGVGGSGGGLCVMGWFGVCGFVVDCVGCWI